MKLVSLENITKYNELLNKKIVKSVNSVKPDSTGNVRLGTEKSTFNKVEFDTGYFSISPSKTYNFDLTGSDIENVPKENVNIRIVAKVTTAHNGFEVGDIAQLSPTLDAHGDYGILGVSTYIQGNTLYLRSGTREIFTIETANGGRWLEKANVQIKAVLTAFVPDDGSILLIAEDQTNTSKLIGLPDGTLTWRDKNLVRSVNNVPADASGNVTISSLVPNQIIQSPVPLTDANLHLLDGALLSGSGAYSAYVDLIAKLFNGGTASSSFCTEAEWQTSNTNYGFCNKFVYDSVANTVRLPKVNSEHGALIKSYSGGSDWYRIYQDGWCEQGGLSTQPITHGSPISITLLKDYLSTDYYIQTGSLSSSVVPSSFTPSITYYNLTTSSFSVCSSSTFGVRASWQASGYTDISDLQTAPIYEYIVIGTISKTDIQINIDNVMSDLALKADKDFTNIDNTAKITIAHNAMPSETYTALTLGPSGTFYTAPADGYFTLRGETNGSNGFVTLIYNINSDMTGNIGMRSYAYPSGYYVGAFMPCKKGTAVKVMYTNLKSPSLYFIYAVGSESEQA